MTCSSVWRRVSSRSATALASVCIINEGEVGDTFYVLVRGVVDVVSKNGGEAEHQYRVLEDGDFFGEIALLENAPRSATVRARVPTLVLALSQGSFADLLQSAPALRAAIEQQAAIRLQRVPDHWQRTG